METLECKVDLTSEIPREVLPHIIATLQKNGIERSTEGGTVDAISMSTGYTQRRFALRGAFWCVRALNESRPRSLHPEILNEHKGSLGASSMSSPLEKNQIRSSRPRMRTRLKTKLEIYILRAIFSYAYISPKRQS